MKAFIARNSRITNKGLAFLLFSRRVRGVRKGRWGWNVRCFHWTVAGLKGMKDKLEKKEVTSEA